MSNTRRNKRQKQVDQEAPKPDKQDYAVANYLLEKVPGRVGDLHGMEVNCFYAEDAVNCLLDSPWATGKDAIFTDRNSVCNFCHSMLCKELFHRASLVKRKPKVLKGVDGNDTPGESGTEGKKSKKKVKKKEEESKEEAKSDEKKVKKVKKLKLNMADDQYFDDGREIYVWIYEPVSWKKFLIGFTILFGAVAMCCYPLWPEWMRIAIYYLSLAGAAFLGVIIALAILRYIVWAIIYVLTMKKHSFFLFPNLTEDCGFFESFVPLYEYSCAGQEDGSKKSKKNKGSSEEKADSKNEEKPADDASADPQASGDSTAAAENPGDDSENSQLSEGDEFEVIRKSELSNQE